VRPDCSPQFALLRPTRIQLARGNLELGDRFSERLRDGVGDPQILMGLAAPLANAHSKFTAASGDIPALRKNSLEDHFHTTRRASAEQAVNSTKPGRMAGLRCLRNVFLYRKRTTRSR
jgi:hypothetical protein